MKSCTCSSTRTRQSLNPISVYCSLHCSTFLIKILNKIFYYRARRYLLFPQTTNSNNKTIPWWPLGYLFSDVIKLLCGHHWLMPHYQAQKKAQNGWGVFRDENFDSAHSTSESYFSLALIYYPPLHSWGPFQQEKRLMENWRELPQGLSRCSPLDSSGLWMALTSFYRVLFPFL